VISFSYVLFIFFETVSLLPKEKRFQASVEKTVAILAAPL